MFADYRYLCFVDSRKYAAYDAPMRTVFPEVSAEQLPFIMVGKRYLLARLLFQIAAIVAFVVRMRGGGPIVAPLSIAGTIVLAAGFAIRRWSMSTLGQRFRGFEVRREAAGLETRGPYAMIRHPGYLGLVLMDAGLPLLVGVPWLLLVNLVLVALVLQRIKLEEGLLAGAYPEYTGFAATRKRLVPGIW